MKTYRLPPRVAINAFATPGQLRKSRVQRANFNPFSPPTAIAGRAGWRGGAIIHIRNFPGEFDAEYKVQNLTHFLLAARAP